MFIRVGSVARFSKSLKMHVHHESVPSAYIVISNINIIDRVVDNIFLLLTFFYWCMKGKNKFQL